MQALILALGIAKVPHFDAGFPILLASNVRICRSCIVERLSATTTRMKGVLWVTHHNPISSTSNCSGFVKDFLIIHAMTNPNGGKLNRAKWGFVFLEKISTRK